MFLIKSGKAKLYKTGAYGKDQIFYIYKKGDLFGYHALLCNENYEEPCEVIEDCEVLFVNKYDFKLLLAKIPQIQPLIIQNSREDLANVIGTTRESLGRLLKEFREDQLIKIDKRAIEVINLKK